MADSFRKAREQARLKRPTTENGEEEKERVFFPSSSSSSSSSSFASKRVTEGGENDEALIRATTKRSFEVASDFPTEESGLRPPSKRVFSEEAEERTLSRWEVAKLHASLKQIQEQSERYRLDAETQRSFVSSQEASYAKKISLLESQLKAHTSSIAKQTSPKADYTAIHEIRAELLETKKVLNASQQEIEDLRMNERTLRHQNESIKEANAALESSQRASQQKLEELVHRLSNDKGDRHSDSKGALEEATRRIKDLEYQLASKTPEKVSDRQTHEISLLLREREREIRQLTAENQRMKAKVKTCETVEDELAELRSKEGRNEKMRDELAHAQSVLVTLKEREEDWISTLHHFFPSSQDENEEEGVDEEESSGSIGNNHIKKLLKERGNPRDILRLIESLQNTCQLQKAEQGQLATLNKQLEIRLAHQQEKAAVFETKLRETEEALEQAQTTIEKGRVELSRAVKDKEMYKKFLDSYEAEDNTVKHDEARGMRIEELEKSLVAAQARANERDTAAHVLELKNRQLEQHLQEVETEAAKMGEALGRGEFNRQTTKVLHMAMNPAKKATEAKAQAQIENLTKQREDLQAENESLKAQLLQGNVVIHEQRGAADIAEKEKEIVKLKKTVSDLEIAKERFYQVFKEKVKEFRESCYMLTGFKIDMKQFNSRNGFVLRSMYAEKEEDTLEFYDTGTKLEVMETQYCKTLDRHILQHLEKCNSIPAFLSEVTLDLFSKQTRVL